MTQDNPPTDQGGSEKMALRMPFIVVTSMGGPYDDESFTAGWHLGQIREVLSHSGAMWTGTVRAASLPQLDMIAMERELNVEILSGDGDWVTVKIVRHTDGQTDR